MGTIATILFAVVAVAVIYFTMRKPKGDVTDSRLPPPPSSQGNGGPLNPEK